MIIIWLDGLLGLKTMKQHWNEKKNLKQKFDPCLILFDFRSLCLCLVDQFFCCPVWNISKLCWNLQAYFGNWINCNMQNSFSDYVSLKCFWVAFFMVQMQTLLEWFIKFMWMVKNKSDKPNFWE